MLLTGGAGGGVDPVVGLLGGDGGSGARECELVVRFEVGGLLI